MGTATTGGRGVGPVGISPHPSVLALRTHCDEGTPKHEHAVAVSTVNRRSRRGRSPAADPPLIATCRRESVCRVAVRWMDKPKAGSAWPNRRRVRGCGYGMGASSAGYRARLLLGTEHGLALEWAVTCPAIPSRLPAFRDVQAPLMTASSLLATNLWAVAAMRVRCRKEASLAFAPSPSSTAFAIARCSSRVWC